METMIRALAVDQRRSEQQQQQQTRSTTSAQCPKLPDLAEFELVSNELDNIIQTIVKKVDVIQQKINTSVAKMELTLKKKNGSHCRSRSSFKNDKSKNKKKKKEDQSYQPSIERGLKEKKNNNKSPNKMKTKQIKKEKNDENAGIEEKSNNKSHVGENKLSYQQFLLENYKIHQNQDSSLKNNDIIKRIAEEWRQLKEQKKRPLTQYTIFYRARYKELKELYKKKKPEQITKMIVEEWRQKKIKLQDKQ